MTDIKGAVPIKGQVMKKTLIDQEVSAVPV